VTRVGKPPPFGVADSCAIVGRIGYLAVYARRPSHPRAKDGHIMGNRKNVGAAAAIVPCDDAFLFGRGAKQRQGERVKR
jgi:hypothetical protein